MTGIVDRIEEEIIVVEVDEKIYNIPKEKCIGEVHEGDVEDVEKYVPQQTEELREFLNETYASIEHNEKSSYVPEKWYL